MADNTRKPGFSKDLVSGEPIGQEALFQLDENGNYVPAGASNPLFTYDFLLAVKRGLVPDHSLLEKFGHNPDVDTGSDPEDIWNGGGLYTGFPTGAAETIEIISSVPASDNPTGVGLRSVRLFGQLAGIDQTEDVDVGDTSIKLWNRMPRLRGLTAGSSDFNVGTITARHSSTTANIFAVMPIGTNRTQIACFTVPAAKTLYLKLFDPRVVLSAGVAASATMAIMIRENGSVWEQTQTLDLTVGGPAPLPVDMAVSYPALTDISARIISVSSSNMSATAQFFGVLVDD